MSNSTEMQSTEIKKPQIKVGTYDFLVQGVMTQDKNSYELKTSKGSSYYKLRLILLNEENNSSVYKAIFSEKDLKEVVFGLGNPAMTHVYNSNPKEFDPENLIGESGKLFLGHKNGYVNIECFMKPKSWDTPAKQASNEAGASFKQELEAEDGVPF